jgi:nitroreductase
MKRLSDESKRNLLALMEKSSSPLTSVYGAFLRNEDYNVYYNAPCLVFIVGRKNHRSLRVDCALAAGYFMFAATARGLGTCWIGLGLSIQDPELRQEIGLPDDYTIVAPIILGYPKGVPAQPSRNPRILKII